MTTTALASFAGLARDARAVWSPTGSFADSSNPASTAAAINGRGDAAVAWAASGGTHGDITAVKVASRQGWEGRWVIHTLRFARGLRAGGVAAVVAASGEVTIAWIDERYGKHRRVRAAFRTPHGEWRMQAVGPVSPFSYADLRLASAPDGTVALVYNAHNGRAKGMAFSRRHPGGAFTPIRAVPGGILSAPTLTIDAHDTAVLAGTALCENEQRSHGVLLTAPRGTGRFGRPRTITPHPATEVRYASTAPGHGIVAWVASGCSTTELLSGPVMAARVDQQGVHTPVALESGTSRGLQMLWARDGVDVSWTNWATPLPTVVVAHGNASCVFEKPHPPTDEWQPIATDGHGDQALQTARPPEMGQPSAVAARPFGSAAVQPSPIKGPAWWTAAGAARGRGLIVATVLGKLRVATWRP